MPWLQDTFAENVQADWGVTYRDVLILDPLNRPLEPAFNLTSQSLADPVIREQLKNRLRQASVFRDTDADGIGDDWEERFMGNLSSGRDSDPDRDGEAMILEFALGNRPLGGSPAGPAIRIMPVEGSPTVVISHRRRLGTAGGLEYVLQRKAENHSWETVDDNFTFIEAVNPYDGTGTEVVTFQAKPGAPDAGLLRILVRAGDGNPVGP